MRLEGSELLWPRARLSEGMDLLARESGVPRGEGLASLDQPVATPEVGLSAWVEKLFGALGFEAVELDATYRDLDDLFHGGPLILGTKDEARFLIILGRRWGHPVVLCPNGSQRRVHRHRLKELLSEDARSELSGDVSRLASTLGLEPSRSESVLRWLETKELSDVSIFGPSWLIRSRPGLATWDALVDARIPRLIASYAGLFAIDYLLFVCSWWVIGHAALSSRFDVDIFLAWGLILLTTLPFRMGASWYEGHIAVALGVFLKRRLMAGAFRLDLDAMRKDGVGRHLSRVMESETVESLVLHGGLFSLAGVLQILIATGVLAMGAGAGTLIPALVVTLVLWGWLGIGYLKERGLWTGERLSLTHDLVEKMIGHPTRLVQQTESKRYDGEDDRVASYLRRSGRTDRRYVGLGMLSRVWLIVAFAAMLPSLVMANATIDASRIAVTIGGLLLLERAFGWLSMGFVSVVDAAVAWHQLRPLYHAATKPDVWGHPNRMATATEVAAPRTNNASPPLLVGSMLAYRYSSRRQSALESASFELSLGDRVLVTSPSGGGKSTLVALMNGLREGDSGTLLAEGRFDRETLGVSAWTRLVATAPQFHENHVFTESFAFNLLMGRRWPPSEEDLDEAEALCQELGLAPLLATMPGGMHQLVGETGWRLSHGERSRLFIARALLQGAKITILDESFGTLDPVNLGRAITCARSHAQTLVVVAHP